MLPCTGRAEEYTGGHDYTGAPIRGKVVDEPFQEQQFSGAGIQLVVNVRENTFPLDLARKGWISQDHVEREARVWRSVARREWIMELNVRLLKLVKVKIEDCDFDHVGIVIVAGECLLLQELPLRRLE